VYNTETVLNQACKFTSFSVVSGPVLVLCVVALCNIVGGYHGLVEIHCVIVYMGTMGL